MREINVIGKLNNLEATNITTVLKTKKNKNSLLPIIDMKLRLKESNKLTKIHI